MISCHNEEYTFNSHSKKKERNGFENINSINLVEKSQNIDVAMNERNSDHEEESDDEVIVFQPAVSNRDNVSKGKK